MMTTAENRFRLFLPSGDYYSLNFSHSCPLTKKTFIETQATQRKHNAPHIIALITDQRSEPWAVDLSTFYFKNKNNVKWLLPDQKTACTQMYYFMDTNRNNSYSFIDEVKLSGDEKSNTDNQNNSLFIRLHNAAVACLIPTTNNTVTSSVEKSRTILDSRTHMLIDALNQLNESAIVSWIRFIWPFFNPMTRENSLDYCEILNTIRKAVTPTKTLVLLLKIIASNHSCPLANHLYGVFLVLSDDSLESLDLFYTLCNNYKNDPFFLIHMGLVLPSTKSSLAIFCFQTALTVTPHHPEALFYLGIQYIAIDNLHAAKQSLRDYNTIQPQEPKAWHELGYTLFLLGQSHDRYLLEAIVCFKMAFQLDPNKIANLKYLINIYLHLGDLKSALKYSQMLNSHTHQEPLIELCNALKTIEENPLNFSVNCISNISQKGCPRKIAICHYSLARYFERLKNWDAAQFMYKEAIKQNPHLDYAYQRLGIICYEKFPPHYNQTEEYLRQALNINPNLFNSWLYLAKYLYANSAQNLELLKQAEEYFLNAVRIDPDNTEGRSALIEMQLNQTSINKLDPFNI